MPAPGRQRHPDACDVLAICGLFWMRGENPREGLRARFSDIHGCSCGAGSVLDLQLPMRTPVGPGEAASPAPGCSPRVVVIYGEECRWFAANSISNTAAIANVSNRDRQLWTQELERLTGTRMAPTLRVSGYRHMRMRGHGMIMNTTHFGFGRHVNFDRSERSHDGIRNGVSVDVDVVDKLMVATPGTGQTRLRPRCAYARVRI